MCVALLTSLGRADGPAKWVVAKDGAQSPVTHYRLAFSIDAIPAEYLVHVTADSQYRSYVNGTPIASGPTSGDPENWRFDTLDIADNLVAGTNLLAAVVWHPAGDWKAPAAFMQQAAGFYLQGITDPSINTGTAKWKACINPAYTPQKPNKFKGYFVIGDFEHVDANQYPWHWETVAFDDRNWQDAVPSAQSYTLIPRRIPMMEHRRERLQSICQTQGVKAADNFLKGSAPITIPANTTATLLLDRGELSNAYPELTTRGGRNAVIKMGYAESLFNKANSWDKGDRNAVKNKLFEGPHDQIICDGGENRTFRPLWFRTFRYIQLDVVTADEPLTLVDLKTETTGYPFQEIASFNADSPELEQIWNVGWRTLRLCAVDNFYDCPFYERLQYIGDTRIEALVSVYVSGDTRLMRKAIDLFNDSRNGADLTASRYPSNAHQVIPTFCNWWIAMVNDYRMLEGDRAFVEKMVPSIDAIIHRFENHTDPATGLILFSTNDEWDFVDWADHLPHLKERKAEDQKPSGLLTLNHMYGIQQAVEIMRYLGDHEKAAAYQAINDYLKATVWAACWDEQKGLLSDDPEHERFTEHANLLGILTDTIPPAKQKAVMQKILAGKPEMTKATIYFRFYYNRALVKLGMADLYLDTLDIWRDQLKLNVTTWAEKPEPSRSDCHAWGSSPNYEFLATVAGITPASPGFKTVHIAPALGDLQSVDAQMPTKAGLIKVNLHRQGENGIAAKITLPDGMTGTLVWNGTIAPLRPGEQTLQL